MADLDLARYEGHTKAPWWDYRQGGDWWISFGVRNGCPRQNVYQCPVDMTDADRALCVDAPLLLAEVRRLRGELATRQEWYDSIMSAVESEPTINWYRCGTCGGPVAREYCCAWCKSFDPMTPRGTAHMSESERLLAELVELRERDEKWKRYMKEAIERGGSLMVQLAAFRHAARAYLAASVPECAETGADLGRESWTPGFRAKYEALEQLAKEPTR